MLLFFVFQEKKEISRPPPAPASEYYAKTPSANGPTHLPDRTLVPSTRSFRPSRIPARDPRSRRHHARGGRGCGGVGGGGSRDGASGGANGVERGRERWRKRRRACSASATRAA